MINNVNLQEVINLLNIINYDSMHPANNSKHPKHKECILVYKILEAWTTKCLLSQNRSKTVKKSFYL